ncbi:MAG: hypothetical protein ACI90V_000649 [Bacillariaceae sp.]|jgi:hypothetical protein
MLEQNKLEIDAKSFVAVVFSFRFLKLEANILML